MKYIKKIDIKLVSLESIFQHDSNNVAYVLYDRDIVVLFIWSRFTLKCVCVLFIGMEVVCGKIN